MNNAEKIINFLKSNYFYTKDEFFKIFNVNNDFIKHNNEYKTCFGHFYSLFKFYSLTIHSDQSISLTEHKKIPNKKFFMVKLPEKEEMEDFYRNHIYSQNDFDNAIIESLNNHNTNISLLFLKCDNFTLLDLIRQGKIPIESMDSIISFIDIKCNIDNF